MLQPGDVVKPFDKLCDVQSDKAAIEITSRYGGKITSLNYAVGAMVKVKWTSSQVGLAAAA